MTYLKQFVPGRRYCIEVKSLTRDRTPKVKVWTMDFLGEREGNLYFSAMPMCDLLWLKPEEIHKATEVGKDTAVVLHCSLVDPS
jgi:hypothetical protein